MNVFQLRNCPICGSSSRENFISSNFALDQSADELAYFKNLWYGLDKSSHFLDYYKCLNCHCIYCPKYFTETSLNELYEFMPPNMELISEDLIQKTQSRYASFLVKSIGQRLAAKRDKSISILELGSDTGIFLIKLISLLHEKYSINPEKINVISIEPNVGIFPILQENMARTRVNFQLFESFEKYLHTCDLPIDLIAAIHVLDHILTPQQFLCEIAKRGNEEFYLYGVVHNVESMLARLLGKSWPPFCLQHPQLYSKRTLPRLFSASFAVKELQISQTSNDYPLSIIANFLGLNFLSPLLQSMYLTIPLGNIQFLCQASYLNEK